MSNNPSEELAKPVVEEKNVNEEPQQDQEQEEQPKPEPEPEPVVATAEPQQQQQPAVEEPEEDAFVKYFNRKVKVYGEEYMKEVMEIAKSDKKQFVITLNVPTGKTEPDVVDPTIQRPIYEGTEDKTFNFHPLSPLDWQRVTKLRQQFEKEKDPDKVVDNQIALYKFWANCYLRMPETDFNRMADWLQMKIVLDACDFRTNYRPK